MDVIDIAKLIMGALTNGVLGYSAYEIFKALRQKYPKMADWPVRLTRPVLYALCTVLVAPVYAICVGMLWVAQPVDWRGWLGTIASYAAASWMVSQQLHAAEKDKFVAAAKAKLGVNPVALVAEIKDRLATVEPK